MSFVMKAEHKQCFDAYAPLSDVRKCINEGHPVLILMRGVPGSGKSHLAMELLKLREGGRIFSTDELFMKDGSYNYQQELLEDFHKKNLIRARNAMKENVTPVIIDNTNVFASHMKQYTIHAVANFYEIYVVEPETEWCRKAAECFRRNQHNVSKEKIKLMLDDLDVEGDPSLSMLIGKDRQLVLESTHYDDDSMNYIPAVPSSSLKQNPFSSLLSMSSTEVSTKAGSPSLSSPAFSLAPPPVTPSSKVKMRDVGTYDTEVSVALSLVGFKDMFERYVTSGHEYDITRNISENPETKDRPSPHASERKNHNVTEASDLDLLVSIFPTESMAMLQHNYTQYGLQMTIKIYCDSGIMPDIDADVKEGSFSYEIAKALQSGSYEPDFVEFPRAGSDSGAPSSTGSSEFSQHLQFNEQVYIELDNGMAQQLEAMFGPKPGSNRSNLISVPKTVLKKLYDCWISSSDDIIVDNDSILNSDAELARKMHEEEMRSMKRPHLQKALTGAQHLNLQQLYQDFPAMDRNALLDFYLSNNCNSTETRRHLVDSGQHPGPAASKNSVITTVATSSQSAASNTILHNQTTRSKHSGRNDLGEYHRRADELWKELTEIKGKKDEILKTAYKYQCAKGTMKGAAAVKQDDARKYRAKEKVLQDEIYAIIQEANRKTDYLDLHYLTPPQAVTLLKERLMQCDRPESQRKGTSLRKLRVVTGYGKNNGNKSEVKDRVVAYLSCNGYNHYSVNPGEISVFCK